MSVKRDRSRVGQMWRLGGIVGVVVATDQKHSPMTHTLLSTFLSGRMRLTPMAEHHLQSWEYIVDKGGDMERIDV